MPRVTAVAALVILALASTGASAYEFIMSWDDGSAEGVFAPPEDSVIAAGFQAPSASARLLGLQMYVCDDGVTNPIDPMMPTTAPFMMYTFKAAAVGEGPGSTVGPGYIPFSDWYSYPEGQWLELWFPSPRDIGDPAQFPGGTFYVAIRWMHDGNPQLGVDFDTPDHPGYWQWEPSSWSPYDSGDVLLRAVVSDTAGSAVIEGSWGSVKWIYR